MDEAETINEFTKQLVKRLQPTAIILFGSRARGTQHEDSDYDLIIVSEHFEGLQWFDRIRSVVKVWMSIKGRAVQGLDIVPYTPAEFAHRRERSTVLLDAMTYAKVLYGNVDEQRSDQRAAA